MSLSSAVKDILLVKLLSKDKPKRLEQHVEEFAELFQPSWTLQQLMDAAEQSLDVLLNEKAVLEDEKLHLTSSGQKKALNILGISSIGDKATWDHLWRGYLVVKAVIADGERLPSAQKIKELSSKRSAMLRNEILRREYKLPGDSFPSKVEKSFDRLLTWVLLGFDAKDFPSNTHAFKNKLIWRMASGEARISPEIAKQAEQLESEKKSTDWSELIRNTVICSILALDKYSKGIQPVKDLAAKHAGSPDLHLGILRRWIQTKYWGSSDSQSLPAMVKTSSKTLSTKHSGKSDSSTNQLVSEPVGVKSKPTRQEQEPILTAEQIMKAGLETSKEGKFGDDLVFINQVWKTLANQGVNISLETFKKATFKFETEERSGVTAI